jgi:hypothetical protein
MVTRHGSSKLGCLVTLLIAVAVAYFGFGVGEVYMRAYRFEDALRTQARYAGQLPDDAIRKYMRAVADSLGLPDAAGAVRIRRSAAKFEISSDYEETLELPGTVRTVRFTPSATTVF